MRFILSNAMAGFLGLMMIVSMAHASPQFSGGGGDAVGSLPNSIAIGDEQVDFLVMSGYQVVLKDGLVMLVDFSPTGWAASTGGTGSTGVTPPVVMTTEWETASGTTTVITPKKPHESYSNHAFRHKAAVKALLNNDPAIEGTYSVGPGTSAYSPPPRAEGSTMVTAWTSDNGTLRHEVRTPPKDGEDPVDQATRHHQSVHALKVAFPPDSNVKTPPKTVGQVFSMAGLRLVA